MKNRNKMISFKSVLCLMMSLCFILSFHMSVFASENASTAVAEARKGVLQVNLVYVDQAGNENVLETGSGFLVGAASGATTVITNYHVITLDDDQKATCTSLYGVDFSNTNNINLQIQVVVKRDVVISASYVNGSEKTDFAILELSQAIHDRSPLKIADSSETVETQEVYALGFPWVTSVVADDQVYTSDDVTITRGIVGKFQTIDEIQYILHDADLGYGNSGGPLVDSNGNVIGVNTMYAGDGANNYSYSIAINEVTEVMDALGITYEKAGESAAEPETSAEENAETEAAEEATEEEAVSEEAVVSEAEPEPIVESESESGMNMTLIIGIAAVVIVIAVIIIIVVVMSGNSKKKKQQQRPPMGGMGPGGYPMPGAPTPARPTVPQQSAPTPPPMPRNTMPIDSGIGETSVLGGGAGETSVLGGGSMQPTATLIRKKNGESARIVKPNFCIGKERAKVDFCIPDNNNISRTHANIVCRSGIYYIVDNKSTNYTFVNGNKIMPGQEVKLNSGDKIKLADEEFEFRL